MDADAVYISGSKKNGSKLGGVFRAKNAVRGTKIIKILVLVLHGQQKTLHQTLKRRLIPHYLKAYEAALLRHNEEQEKEAHLNLIAQSIVTVTQGRIADHSRARKTVYFENGTAEIWSSGDINLNLNRLPIEKVIQIVAMLKV